MIFAPLSFFLCSRSSYCFFFDPPINALISPPASSINLVAIMTQNSSKSISPLCGIKKNLPKQHQQKTQIPHDTTDRAHLLTLSSSTNATISSISSLVRGMFKLFIMSINSSVSIVPPLSLSNSWNTFSKFSFCINPKCNNNQPHNHTTTRTTKQDTHNPTR